ncbi:MAG: sodium:solute symporter family protein [Bacillota bacterium]
MVNIQWTSLDWFAIILYLAALVLIGWYVSKKVTSSDDYYVAGRALTYPIAVGTIMATWYGSGAVFGTAELAFGVGIAAFVVWCIPAHLGRIPLALWVAPKVRNIEGTTIPALLGQLYAKPVAILGAILIVLFSTRLQDIVSVGIMGNSITGIENWVVGSIIVGIVLIYTLFGGLWSVAMTDVLQFLLMTTITLLLLPILWIKVGGFEGLQAVLPAGHFTPTGGMPFSRLLVFFLLGFQVYADPAAYQRFSAANSANTAKRAYLTCLIVWLAFDVVMTLLGIAARGLYPEVAPAKAFLAAAINNLPPFVAGLWIASILSAIMSSMDSFFLVGATTLANDIYKPLFKKDATDADLIKMTRIFVILIGGIGCAAAFQFKMVLDAAIFLGGLYLASALVPVIGGLFWTGRRTVAGGFMSMLAGMVTTFIWQLLKNPYGLKPMLIALPISFVFFLIGNQFGKPLTSGTSSSFENYGS